MIDSPQGNPSKEIERSAEGPSGLIDMARLNLTEPLSPLAEDAIGSLRGSGASGVPQARDETATISGKQVSRPATSE